MLGHVRPLICLLALVAFSAGVAAPEAIASSAPGAAAPSSEEGGDPTCASAVTSGYTAPSAPEPGHPCWVDIKPYPFGSFEGPSGNEEAGPVELESPRWREEHPQCVRFGRERTGLHSAAPDDECYLTVTSMAFRSWNHGLAATYPQALITHNAELKPRADSNPYGVWIFDGNIESGEQWFPDPTFPGHKACPGHTIAWAGKLDYWLVGGPTDRGWSRLCRFDGETDQWQPFSVPAATLRRVAQPIIPPTAPTSASALRAAPVHSAREVTNLPPREGGITSAACMSWSDCWFFGTYGVVVHWNGFELADASPSTAERWLDGEYLAAATNEDPVGNPFAVVVSGTAEFSRPTRERELIPARPSAPGTPGAAPPELFRSVSYEFTLARLGGSSALPFAPPTDPQDGEETEGTKRPLDPGAGAWKDPYRTDLVAVGFNEAGQGWVAGNPAGLRANWQCTTECGQPAERRIVGAEAPAPLVPVSLSGQEAKCTGATFAPEKLSFSPLATPSGLGSFLWSSLAVVPASGEAATPAAGEALAGGFTHPTSAEGEPTEMNRPGGPEPVIAQASCDGAMIFTRFRTREAPEQENTEHFETVAADRGGTVIAISASAKNDAWAATSEGKLIGRLKPEISPPERETVLEAPHLYQLTDGRAPEAPEGNEEEERPVELQENPPIFVFEPEPETPLPPTPPPITTVETQHEQPAVYGVKALLRHVGSKFSLYLSFKLRRPITLGAQGLLRGRVVARARARHFTGHRGTLILQLDRKHWPTKIRFTT
jgi:hypothetical protein